LAAHAGSAEFDASEARERAVGLASGADSCRRRREREGRDEQAERPTKNVESQSKSEGRGAEKRDADLVREAGRPRILHRALAHPRLDELEVGEAGEAPATPERQSGQELRRENGEQRPPAREQGEERERSDHSLVEARCVRVDHVQVAIWIGRPGLLHFGKPISIAASGPLRCVSVKPRIFLTYRLPDPVVERLGSSFVLAESIAGSAGLVTIPADVVGAELFDAAGPELRVVANFGVGYDTVDVEEATRRGILVANTPGVLTKATAELTLALLLGLLRRVVEGDRLVRRRDEWALAPTFMLGESLAGKTLGIVGLGRIGREVARLAEAFGMRIVYTRGSGPYEERALGELLAEADAVSIHVPLTPETRHLIGPRELALMRPNAVLVNVSRGAVVDEAALVDALEAGRVAGAALDVYEHEPDVSAGLLERDDVVLSPHLGSATHAAREAMGMLCADALEAVLLRDELPRNAVNPEAWDAE
jgi:glyoxylate reductase